jgi:hypothetical protein
MRPILRVARGSGDPQAFRGHSSAGRALQSHCRGRGFESPCLHPVPEQPHFLSLPFHVHHQGPLGLSGQSDIHFVAFTGTRKLTGAEFADSEYSSFPSGRQASMQRFQVRLIGRRPDQPQRIVLRDEEGRYFLRPACGSRAVRITARDAEHLMRQYRYDYLDEADWYESNLIEDLGCPLNSVDVDTDQMPIH